MISKEGQLECDQLVRTFLVTPGYHFFGTVDPRSGHHLLQLSLHIRYFSCEWRSLSSLTTLLTLYHHES